MKILVIDDEAPFRYMVAKILIGAGYEVAMAEDGEHGLAMFHRDRPDLVICDLIMPRLNGLETIAQIRRESPAMKVLAISGGGHSGPNMNLDGLAAALEAGASEIIVKPVRAEDLLAQVNAILG
jgi:DNA-binding response OmpR family regulator